ncbi:unnamed protein product [Calicophoron daubneyi]|uniref:Uncharacterized protein n=1 Tax=Calicophoron daubneyi TaxID=300641 RepID=A0AAV2TYD7_CALDB
MHSGWIWTIESYETTVVTGCWDGNLRSWALSATGLSPLATYQLRAPVLCSAFLNSHLLVVGAQQSVYLIDLRTPSDQPPALCMRHKKAVLCLDAFGNASGNSSIEWDVNACPVLPDGDQTLSTYDSYSSLSSIAASDGVADFPMDPITLFTDGSEAKKEIDPVEQITEDLGKSSATCTRVTDHPINENQPESGDAPPQTSNSTSSTNLFTGSSDHTLAGWDLRNPSTPAIKHRFTTYPRKISLLDNGELWVAEPPGRIHVFDTRQGNLQLVHTNELPGWNRGFGGLKAVPGCVFASGLHGTVEAFHPTRPLIPMGSKPVAEKIKASPTCLTARAGLLAVGSGDGSVYIWTTKRKTAEES